jgi:glutamate-1-semialdehyde 2,1-aminomutase
MNFSEKLNYLIPGGAHTYSRGDDQYPENAPSILTKGEGCYVFDTDGNKLLDYGMGLRAVTVGYGHKEISEAAIEEIFKGNGLTRASLTELKAAELITNLIPSADMVKFGKNGSTVTSAAVKLARAYTNKKYIARCNNHPFFSYDDWFIGDTPLKKGIPKEIYNLTIHFNYNDISSLEKLFEKYKNNIACVILEPMVTEEPKDNFLQKIKELCQKNNSIFILDEMITGFRWHLQGAQKYFNIEADLTTFGKGMANGFSVSALTGKREIMNLGGIKEDGAERVFLVSTTHGAEMCGLGAFIKTVELYKKLNIVEHIWNYGRKMIDGMNTIAKQYGIEKYFYVEGYPCSPNYVCKNNKEEISLAFRTLFAQEMIKSKILIPWIALSYSHTDRELEITLEATKKALKVYCNALEEGYEKYLIGKIIKPVFRQFN